MNTLRTDILWLGYEDLSGLWDVDWGDGHGPAEAPVPGRVAVVEGLARDGLIELLAGPESVDFEEARPLASARIAAALRDPRTWRAPERGEPTVRFRTTEKGFAEYRRAIGWSYPEEGGTT